MCGSASAWAYRWHHARAGTGRELVSLYAGQAEEEAVARTVVR
jgi:hypothetical protein